MPTRRPFILAGAFAAAALVNTTARAQTLDLVPLHAAANDAPRTIVSADFNRDGWPDLALGGTGRASIAILLSHGVEDGDEGQRFKPLQEIVVGGGPFDLAVGDLDRDGFPDIAVANADANAVTLLFGGASGFRPKVDIPMPGNPRGIAIADFNRDGKPDIIVTKYLATTLDVLFGAGDGTFPTRRTHTAPANTQGVVAVDLNEDGWMDAATASITGTVTAYYMTAGGATREDVRLPAARSPWNVITTGDFDRDGNQDVAVGSQNASVAQILFHHPAVSRPSGSTVAFWTATDTIPVVASPRGIETGDLNQDGVLELVLAGRSSSAISVVSRNADGTYRNTEYASGAGARDVALLDFDNDGRIDVATANENGDSATVLQNVTALPRPGYTFAARSVPFTYDNSAFAVGDFNDNGLLDVVKKNSVLLDGTTSSRFLGSGNPAEAGGAGDFNGDGRLDVVLATSTSFRVFFGDGAGGFADGQATAASGFITHLKVADMNRDGRPDVVTTTTDFRSAPTGAVEVFLGQANGTFTRSTQTNLAATWLEVADVDRDGKLDAVAASLNGVFALLGNGLGGWKGTKAFEEGTPRYGFALGNVNEDGALDLVIADGEVGQFGPQWTSRVTVALGAGDGTFSAYQQYETADPDVFSVNSTLVLGDLTNDGHLDIFTSGGELLAGTGGGIFSDAQRFAVSGFPNPLIADIDGDGLDDLLGFTRIDGFNGDGEQILMLNTTRTPAQNRPPVGVTLPDAMTRSYAEQFSDEEERDIRPGTPSDPDLHALRYRWTLADGTIVGTGAGFFANLPTGTYDLTVTVDDYRGGVASDRMRLTIAPYKEAVLFLAGGQLHGAWQRVADETAADGMRVWHPNQNAPKLNEALANPVNYIEMKFVADPTQVYKLWVRLKADNNNWANDSVFVQFTGAKDGAGNRIYAPGTTSALPVNLEECSNCGVSGWGWEDDGWGAVNRNGVTVRFPEGGVQTLRIQTREDGVSLDQFVLSSEKYLTTRPGTAKNDTTKLRFTGPF